MYRKCEGKNFNPVLTLISGCEFHTASAAAAANTAYLTEHHTDRHILEQKVLT